MTKCDYTDSRTKTKCSERAVEFYRFGNKYRARCSQHEVKNKYETNIQRMQSKILQHGDQLPTTESDFQHITEDEYVVAKIHES